MTNFSRKQRKLKSRNFKPTLTSRWSLVRRLVNWARSEYFTPSTGGLDRTLEYFLGRVERVLFARGVEAVVPFVKRARFSFLQWIATADHPRENRRWRRKVRGYLGRHAPGTDLKTANSRNILRAVLTALITTRCLVYPASLNIHSIVSEPYGFPYSGWVKNVRRFWKLLGFGLPGPAKDLDRSRWMKYHISTKSGPNGPAMWSALADLAALPGSLVESIRVVGGSELHGNMEVLLRNLKPLGRFFPVKGERFRRLISISDKEKPRTVATLDYWSQTCLRPLHFFLFGVLKKIPQDVTFDQGSFLEKVSKWKSVEYFSIDLKDATDRFPMTLIREVLEGGFTKEFVSHWANIMVGYPFDSVKGKVSYRAGNPMGAYSSWASFAVAHHFVVFDCCEELGISWKTAQYVILGDDVLIGDSRLAAAYRSRIYSLGVEVSIEKTLVSRDTLEFAKRYIHKGEEITPFPLSAVVDTYKSIPLVVSALVGEERRDLVPKCGIPGAVESLYRYLGHSRADQRRVLAQATDIELSVRFSNGSLTAEEFLSKLLGGQSACLRVAGRTADENAKLVIRKAVELMFADSLSNPKLDLGRLAVDLVERFTGSDHRFAEDGFSLIYALPFLGCYGQVEEMYIRALKDYRLHLEDPDDSLTRALCIPLNEKAFAVPVKDLRMVLQGRFAATVQKVASDLLGYQLPAGFSKRQRSPSGRG